MTAFADFHASVLRSVASGLGISYVTLANNLEGVSYSSIRQASIPISVLIVRFLLKETNVLKRLNWSLVLALRIVLIIVSEYVYTSGA